MAIDPTRIVKTVGKLRRLLKTDSSLLTPEEVHDLRTHARRFEASTKAMQLCAGRKEQRFFRRLRQIRKRAGRVRDMDVFTSYLLGLQFDDHRDCAIRLVEHLAERHRLAKKLRNEIAKHGRQARQGLKKSSTRVENFRSPDAPSGSRRAAGTALNLSAGLAFPAKLNRGNLHPYRLKVKELRYVLQMADGHGNEHFVNALGASKDAIGEWHDWEELIAIAEQLLDEDSTCPVLQKLKQTSNVRYESALDTTSKLRRKFVAMAHMRKARRPATPPPRPAFEALAAITS